MSSSPSKSDGPVDELSAAGTLAPDEGGTPASATRDALRRSALQTSGAILAAQRRAEGELRATLELLNAILDAVDYGIIATDAAGAVITFNRGAERMLGYSSGEVLGRSGFALWHDAAEMTRRAAVLTRELGRWVTPGFDTLVAKAQQFGGADKNEWTCACKDGSRFPATLSVTGLRDSAGSVTGFLCVIEDITERKRAEDERHRMEAQMRQAQKMDSLGTLAGGIAHEFNNLLGTIIGNVELAHQDVAADHASQASLAEAAKASRRARDLVQQILTFSRQQKQEQRFVHLQEVLEESVKLLRATLPAGIEIVMQAAPDTPSVLADRAQIQQAVTNLCTNAWQAMERGTGRIDITLAGVAGDEVRAHADLEAGRHVLLRVADNGKGMDAGTLERIFDPFFTTRPPGEGAGLGLSVVDGIVRSHRGAVAVASVPGQGTVFEVYFPAAKVDAKPPPPLSAPVRGRGGRIIYVDDEESLVFLVTRLLKRVGYEVRGFTQASEALAVFADDPAGCDLFVSDVNMPVISGLQVVGEVLRRRPDLPVVLTSGAVTDALRAQARALGVREVIYKPDTVSELAAAIDRLLTGGN